MVGPKLKKDVPPSSVNGNSIATAEETTDIIRNAFSLMKQPRCRSDEEVAERLDWYFQEYAKAGVIPTVEGMSLALGVSRMEVNNWERGIKCSPDRTEMIRRAKEVLAEIDAQLVSKGKIPVVSYIFRSKNFHHMQDKVEYTYEPRESEADPVKLIEAAEMLPDE